MQKAVAPTPAIAPTPKLLTETQAAEAMWTYYKANRMNIHTDCKQFRDVILFELMQGATPEKVFERFALYPEPEVQVQVQPVRRARAAR